MLNKPQNTVVENATQEADIQIFLSDLMMNPSLHSQLPWPQLESDQPAPLHMHHHQHKHLSEPFHFLPVTVNSLSLFTDWLFHLCICAILTLEISITHLMLFLSVYIIPWLFQQNNPKLNCTQVNLKILGQYFTWYVISFISQIKSVHS